MTSVLRSILSAEKARDVLAYDRETGSFRWKVDISRCVKAGQLAGCKHGTGYIVITVNGRQYQAHRLAWLYVYGEWPQDEVDHINGVRDDNRIANLRKANVCQNQWNSKIHRDNTSGFKGVCFHRGAKKYMAYISANGKNRFLGYFETAELAHTAYCNAANSMHGEFANHG